MEIKTKYNINDELWFIISGKAIRRKVLHIKIHIQGAQIHTVKGRGRVGTGNYKVEKVEIGYQMESGMTSAYFSDPIPENRLFTTKEELLNSL